MVSIVDDIIEVRVLDKIERVLPDMPERFRTKDVAEIIGETTQATEVVIGCHRDSLGIKRAGRGRWRKTGGVR